MCSSVSGYPGLRQRIHHDSPDSAASSQYLPLNLDQFAAGIALGRVTPGPIVIKATFVGYKVVVLGSSAGNRVVFFSPCFVLAILVMPIYMKIKENPWVKPIFKGIVASFIGLMVVVVIGMGRHSLTDYTTAALSVTTLAVLRFTKIDVLWVVSGGTAIYMIRAKLSGL